MIRAGELDRIIRFERATAETISESGALTQAWAPIGPPMRAKLVSLSTAEKLRDAGNLASKAVVFQTRWLDGLLVTDRVVYAGAALKIIAIREIGRRKALEITCEASQ